VIAVVLCIPGAAFAVEAAPGWDIELYAELPRTVDTASGSEEMPEPQEIDIDSTGTIYVGVGQIFNRVYALPPTAPADLPAEPAVVIPFADDPDGIAVDAGDGMWFTDDAGQVCRRDPAGDVVCYDAAAGGTNITTLTIDFDGRFGSPGWVYVTSKTQLLSPVDPAGPKDQEIVPIFELPFKARVIDFGTPPWLWLGEREGIWTMARTDTGFDLVKYPLDIRPISALRYDRRTGHLWVGAGGEDRKIYRIDLGTDTPQVIVSEVVARGFAFGEDGAVYFSSIEDGSVYRLRDGGPTIPFYRGDVNQDGWFNISDPVLTTRYIFVGRAIGCEKAADVNDDGRVFPEDAIYSLRYLFTSGPPPVVPFESCGQDPTPDELTCETFPRCQ
jgi:hypothetical protein